MKEIFFKEIGKGPKTILALHGNSSSHKVFEKLVQHFGQFRWILLDLPGHGNSPRLKEYGLKSICREITSFLHSKNIEPDILVGHSLGGHAAINISNSFSSLKNLILMGTPPVSMQLMANVGPYGPDRVNSIFQLETPERQLLDDFFDQNLEPSNKDKKEGLIDQFLATDGNFRKSFLEDSMKEGLSDEWAVFLKSSLEKKILIGETDNVVNPEYIGRLSDRYSDLFEQVPGGHYQFLFSPPQGFLKAFETLLNQ